MTAVKICGIRDAAGFDAAAEAGAEMVGFVFYPPSPRAVTPAEAAALSARLEGGPLRVGLFVDPTDAELEAVLAVVPLGLIQLHGAESVARCAEIRARFGVPVMKAVGIAAPEDLEALAAYAPVVDRFLLDAKPPAGASLPGGNAAAFDWRLTAGRVIPRPWLLAGGLTPETVAEAIRQSGAAGVDVSSGVERARGVKDPGRIREFVGAARHIICRQ
ncbi:phosphoribosylanthranilate isomerase [Belnapia rosea]|uniref:N-(5'-phosphoribosyl)anthranilate isomerase n=1 Tax=Belnapia rosea TaxID=938405 RepID=A0A1G6ZGH7_9PROT|nr:phosphoribosylanthranilate isomerase [Belnapia rosea]SDE01709.1 phosphoribosylanthranilate isomerase [Belnapia rosea]